ncbi:ribonuclease HI [Desulfonatronum thioautotrophicum]|uniref:ribonuclease HI n=1 Tax=Desulfonatronum thioautotrophicum TaxID=617001 RepID=UPI0005EB2A2B|nr:ribonuclease HI [Desulfonatronum thioautotrophicum]
MSEQNMTRIYTDGACLGNPGPGGWGAVVIEDDQRRELSGGYGLTTNNRMELLAVIEALSLLAGRAAVELYTDSKYIHDAVEKGWLAKWKRNGWRTADKKAVKNQDLWLQIDALLSKHDVHFHWVRGHSGNPENECCDKLAGIAAQGRNLPKDSGYAR